MTDMATKTAAFVSADGASKAYEEYVNPQWVALLNLLDMNVEYERCVGCELFTKDGRRILDFLSGHCVHNTDHNHPAVIQALKDKLDKSGNNFMVLKAAPPLVVSEAQLDKFVAAIRDVVELADSFASFSTEALALARRAVNI